MTQEDTQVAGTGKHAGTFDPERDRNGRDYPGKHALPLQLIDWYNLGLIPED